MRKMAIWLIKFGRNFIFYNKLPTCRFYPSCSAYAVESIKKKGIILGLAKTAVRLLRCHPFSKGGYDPV